MSGGRAAPRRERTALFAQGEPMIWLTGGGLALALAMIAGLLALVVVQGSVTLWPGPVTRVELNDGRAVMGEVARSESVGATGGDGPVRRRLFRTGNFELTGEHFQWVADSDIRAESRPEWALVVERTAWGRFYGAPQAFLLDGRAAASDPASAWAMYEQHRLAVQRRLRERQRLESRDIGRVNRRIESARLAVKSAELRHGMGSVPHREAVARFEAVERQGLAEHARLRGRIEALNRENARFQLALATADGWEQAIPLADIVRACAPNRLGLAAKWAVYGSRWLEFLSGAPREANSEGGVFPALFGTALMTVVMSVAVVPFGVMAALYLREYAKAGPLVSLVRIAINNLAGVPSIVFGVFGLGFFCYIVGGWLDRSFFAANLPNPTFGKGGLLWSALTLALLTLPVVIVATEESLAAVPNSMREGSYACGAGKWQTIRRIVLPRALPGILTGTILAMARGAGEVAPLMLVGAVKLAPELPVDAVAPFLHPERSFMHLGFHIFDLGFQSPNSEAARPMVFTVTLLLIALIFLLNLVAVLLRARLKKKFVTGAF
ncbi:MAG TPA: phosphate ABC transporter permease PstA [Kiritimatiellia bacterium]|nr:phosphate ABC transporter permease PstA [Kiritimatiellia bacterium]HRZ11200.1 phosphate ABC transporter permease PstA [Kiritimatiellia bacterium]HSA19051.1 phosphate ABC transporter permease PstA [Kiritimatiellia bacterium]